MIVFINGPFGGGKTSVAQELLSRIPDSTLFDPEEVGFVLRTILPGREKDFQDLPPWRPLVAATTAEILAYTGGALIAPMSILRRDYATEIFSELDKRGITVCHIVLHADTTTVTNRITGHQMFPDDPARSQKVIDFRLRNLARYQDAYREWLAGDAHVIDTTALTPAWAADLAAAIIRRMSDGVPA
ncbi:ATP-binding protein [Planomonospora sp. ID82291]|uniref:ATP-binding protein n=1 Tax=Planomonospora sp. ID82291 TaxID=2738136 RepID=UPI0018C41287|nr:ATP-binding protein [Planomonospora sp. ID82291]MBG0818676.1 ATP/GTP-binding protein [Planomonospora sp. ID82291]